MPELPEVEIVKQSLDQKICFKKIIKVIIKNRNLRFKIPVNFKNFLVDKKIIKIERFSKYLILNFSNGTFCLVHLGMSGTIHLVKNKKDINFTNTSFYNNPNLPKKHNHIKIFFKDIVFIYNDPRRFGFFVLIKNKEELKKRFNHLGPEPFFKSFNLKYVLTYFRNREKNIKNILLDQGFVSGIGNIYASEILFYSKIKPTKRVKKLSLKECKKIIYFSKKVLKKAIARGGSSIRDFKNTSGESGLNQKEFRVYQRENLECLENKCEGKILKNFIGNRSTFFCNTCQK